MIKLFTIGFTKKTAKILTIPVFFAVRGFQINVTEDFWLNSLRKKIRILKLYI